MSEGVMRGEKGGGDAKVQGAESAGGWECTRGVRKAVIIRGKIWGSHQSV